MKWGEGERLNMDETNSQGQEVRGKVYRVGLCTDTVQRWE